MEKSKLCYNFIIAVKAATIGIWFFGLNRILYRYFPSPSFPEVFALLAVSSAILLCDDGMLSELHDLKPSTVAAIANQTQNGGLSTNLAGGPVFRG